MTIEVQAPWNLIKVKFTRHYPGYIYRREIVDDSEYGGDGSLEMISCYSDHTGLYIGTARDARNLCKKYGIRQLQGRTKESQVCSIGFNPETQRWFGWSHRAIASFGIGDSIEGHEPAKTLEDAKKYAKFFAKLVS